MLIEKINKDYIKAMKEKDTLKANILNMLRSAIKYKEIENREKEISDEDVIDLVKKEIKRHEESIEMYKTGGRKDLQEKEEKELQVLKSYLPEQISEDEVKRIISEIILKLNATSKNDFGKVMKEAMSQLRGKAEGSLIKRVVEESLKNN